MQFKLIIRNRGLYIRVPPSALLTWGPGHPLWAFVPGTVGCGAASSAPHSLDARSTPRGDDHKCPQHHPVSPGGRVTPSKEPLYKSVPEYQPPRSQNTNWQPVEAPYTPPSSHPPSFLSPPSCSDKMSSVCTVGYGSHMWPWALDMWLVQLGTGCLL